MSKDTTVKLDPAISKFLIQVIRTAHNLKFNQIVVEKEVIRGMNEHKTVLVIDQNVPADMPFNGIGIQNVPKLMARLGLIDDLNIHVDVRNGFVFGMEFKGKGVSIKNRCANHMAIKTPRKSSDVPNWSIEFNPEVISQITKAQAAMGAATVKIRNTEEGFSFNLTNLETSDEYNSQIINGYAERLDDDEDTLGEGVDFTFNYDIGVLLSVIKFADRPTNIQGPEGSIKIEIGQRGVMFVRLNGIQVLLSPLDIS